jgi:Flp pilus assembly protein TadD
MRELWATTDRKAQLDPLRKLSQEADLERWPAQSLLLLYGALIGAGDPHSAEALLRRSQTVHPQDVWVNYNLGMVLEKLSRRDEAIRFYTAARAIRPETAHELAHALAARGQSDEAIWVFRHLRHLRPGNARHLARLGEALKEKGLSHEADEVLEAVVAVSRERVRLRQHVAVAHFALGYTLAAQAKYGEAIAEYRTAIRLKPNYAEAHNNLGVVHCQQGRLEEGIAELRTALQLEPNYAEAHANLGNALQDRGELEEAIAEYRAALRIKPDEAAFHSNLGTALQDQGREDEAIAQYREALRLEPNNAIAHMNLGNVLKGQGKMQEAMTEYRTALSLQPNYAPAHFNLGLALRSQGEFKEAIAELRKARDLPKTDPGLAQQVERELKEIERQASLATRLPAVLAGKLKPADATEMLGFAQLCYEKKLQNASARFWSQAFQAQPKLADDMQPQNRYNAACAAALAGSGQGKDVPAPDEATKAQWRKQALEWLRADLAFWTRQVETGPPQARQFVAQTLQHWKADTDLAGIRDEAALAKLPADEQKACRALWSEVDAILRRVLTK